MSGAPAAEGLRQTARMFASGIVIVTACAGDELFAKTVSAFHALSMEPPLVSVSIGRGSPLIGLIRSAGCFGISILSREQQDLSKSCAIPGNGRMSASAALMPITGALTGAPIVADCLGYFDCAFHRTIDAGDHQIILGQVIAADRVPGHPLLYFDGSYCGLIRKG